MTLHCWKDYRVALPLTWSADPCTKWFLWRIIKIDIMILTPWHLKEEDAFLGCCVLLYTNIRIACSRIGKSQKLIVYAKWAACKVKILSKNKRRNLGNAIAYNQIYELGSRRWTLLKHVWHLTNQQVNLFAMHTAWVRCRCSRHEYSDNIAGSNLMCFHAWRETKRLRSG
jgi:hypothetical protein